MMNTRKRRQKILLKAGSALFLLAAALFASEYCGRAGASIPPVFESDPERNRTLFLANFFVPLAVAWGCLILSEIGRRHVYRILGWLMALASAGISVYTVPAVYPVKLLLFLPFFAAAGSESSREKLAAKGLTAAVFFGATLLHPSFIGDGNISLKQFNPGAAELSATAALCLLAFIAAFFLTRLSAAKETLASALDHMRTTENQLLVINRKLSENARLREEEATKNERLRITRDMHDSLGYIFTNMIALSDAATSSPDLEANHSNITRILQIIRNQAADGLHHTREALHLIREIQNNEDSGLQSIWQMKSIFEEVTDIKIDIETGNMRKSYPGKINTALKKIIQEALTNSLRHGHATKILIQFWDFDGELQMTVSDNGSGAKVIVKGIGFQGMEERLNRIGGKLAFSSPEEGGFRLSVTIPAAAENALADAEAGTDRETQGEEK